MTTYDHRAVEEKWQAQWDAKDTFLTPEGHDRPKYYVLDMFPYPSGSGLHVGHPKGYTATDVVARAKRMMGFNVLRVMGWDSFGLPAERQADKEGKHPREITERNIAIFKAQLRRLGLSYDWTHELATSDAKYYKWTQWIFLKLYERGLAYQAEVGVNWCPALGTVLANEEVKDGHYVETGDVVERRMMKQWMLRITAYADRLVDDLEGLDWPDGVIKMQKEWIGRSHGAEVRFAVEGQPAGIEVFTTRPDTLFGCSYVVLAPEHPLVDTITTADRREAVVVYRAACGKRSDRDRQAQAVDAPKTGTFTGAYAIVPVSGARVPVWVADYVLAGYGTGAVFACPAHDERDHAFAHTFGLPILEVVSGGDVQTASYAGDGPHVNSGFLDGMDIEAAKTAVIAWLEAEGHGRGRVLYRLRDWLFSRQRYWGEPFPIVETADGAVPLPESALPVELPDLAVRSATADGRPPLARAEAWRQTVDPNTGAPALRETNTMPQWAGSCWYYLRFLSPLRDDVAWDPAEEKYWMPVDLYVGGAEHAVLHLLYARFWHKVLFDLGLVSTKEPFQRLYNQGMIHDWSYQAVSGKYYYPEEISAFHGAEPVAVRDPRADRFVVAASGEAVTRRLEKMSKSKCNVVTPDEMCDQYGADALRLYELFMGPLEDGALWETAGVSGTRRFLERSWRLVVDQDTGERPAKLVDGDASDRALERSLHLTIKKVTEAMSSLRLNTAIADLMTFVNDATKATQVPVAYVEAFLRLLAPFAPHVAEELWERLGHTGGITFAPWPAWDDEKTKADLITVVVQVNGKLRAQLSLLPGSGEDEAVEAALADPAVQRFLAAGTIRKRIYVPGRLLNFVVG